MDWDKLKIFHTVAEASSFTKASTILNLSQSAISRQIQALESDLKVQLFERHARGLVLTENGEYLYKSAHEIISKLKDVESNLSGHKDKLNGKLEIVIHYKGGVFEEPDLNYRPERHRKWWDYECASFEEMSSITTPPNKINKLFQIT